MPSRPRCFMPPSSPSWSRPGQRTSGRRHSGGPMGSPTSCAPPATTGCCPSSVASAHTCRCSSLVRQTAHDLPDGRLQVSCRRHPGGTGLLHPTSVGRIACDAQILPVLLNLDGVPMALGRSQRLFTVAPTTPARPPRRRLPLPRLLAAPGVHRRPPRRPLVRRVAPPTSTTPSCSAGSTTASCTKAAWQISHHPRRRINA